MPARSEGNFRLYNEMHVERLLFMRHCRSLHMTLDEIRRLLSFRDAPQHTRMLVGNGNHRLEVTFAAVQRTDPSLQTAGLGRIDPQGTL